MCIWRQCNKDPSAALGMTVLGERIGSQGWCATFLEDGILASSAFPIGEGARRADRVLSYERQMGKVERGQYIWENRESLTANDKDFSLRSK